jgi:energy-coupling factor transport system ATP-binding protein
VTSSDRPDIGSRVGIAIATKGLGFVYPDGTRALTGVDLQIAAGERLAIIGQNGSGKSTLVRHFNGLLRATEGQVVIGPEVVNNQHVAALARQVGIVFQNPDRQIFSGRAHAEVAFGARNAGLSGTTLDARVAAALRLVGLDEMTGANPYDLGYSRRKLLATASVLAMGTPAIVLDEPTTGQDSRGIARIRALVALLSEMGRTVIAISHDMRFVAEAFPRVVVMRAGSVILDGSPGDVFAKDRWTDLASTYLEPPLPARLGAELGLGSTPTDAALIQAMEASAP